MYMSLLHYSSTLFTTLLSLQCIIILSTSQKTCPRCGSMQVPYPLSTNPNCGDPNYSLFCNPNSHHLYFQALNGSSYLILRIQPLSQRFVIRPSPWLKGSRACITQDMVDSEGLWLNQSLPFNITNSNTVFLFNCSPRLFISPLNCTAASLCHRYLDDVANNNIVQERDCASGPGPCCTFIAGGLPSSYKIRLHSSGCRAFRSVLRPDPEKPAGEWEQGLEIQWASPLEPACRTQADCDPKSTCSSSLRRCLCNKGYFWDGTLATCSKKTSDHIHHHSKLIKLIGGLVSLTLTFIITTVAVTVRFRCNKLSRQLKIVKEREDMLKARNGGRSSPRMFGWKEVKKATDGFAKENLLGSGGFGEVYKGVLEDGTLVAVKSAKVGNLKGIQQVLNEVGILSLINHKNLVRLLGCCIEAKQPLMVYEYIPNGALYDHLHNKSGGDHVVVLDWKTRLKIAHQTAGALAYLHTSAHTPIYHRDVKSTNILIDVDLNAKLSDFGLSRIAQPDLSHVSTCAQGTLGYLDPEYYRNFQLTDKSDVYSFGVVLLELLTSKKVVDFTRDADDVNLAVYVRQRAEDGRVREVFDEWLFCSGTSWKSAEMFCELAVCCLKEKKEERPSMKQVAEVLEYITETASIESSS